MKTICFVVPNFPVASETFVTNQIIALKKKGYNVCVLAHNLKAIEQSTQKKLLEEYGILENVVEINYKLPKSNIVRLGLGIIPIIKYFKYWLKTPHLSIKHRFTNLPYVLNFFSNFRHVDVFHIQFANGGKPIEVMSENGFLQAKIITTFHGHDAHYKNDKELKSLQQRYKNLFTVSNFVTVNTSYLVPKVMALGCDKNKIEVVPMGIDTEYFNTKISKQLPVDDVVKLISIGRLIKLKGFDLAIDAVKLLVAKGLNIKYTIVGTGQKYNHLQNKIKALQLEKQVELVGYKNQAEIKGLLKSNHIYLMSSITNAKGQAEAQGIVSAEAQAMGLPVIAFDSGGVPDTILNEQTGLLVAEKDIDVYAKAIFKLINDPQRYKMMSLKAQEYANNVYSIDVIANQFLALYGDDFSDKSIT